jgi:hypothetical protein
VQQEEGVFLLLLLVFIDGHTIPLTIDVLLLLLDAEHDSTINETNDEDVRS